MNKQQLASTIWQSANQMRSKIEANEYKDYILGFMFYKYLSDREISFLKGEKYSDEDIKKVTADDEKLVKHISENIGYFIAYEDLFSSWLSKGDDFDVSDVRDALSNFDANIEPTYKKLFENIFKTLQSGLSKLGETSTKQTKSIKALLKLIKRIPMDGKQDYDVLGFIYEYLISMFAANAGKKAGEFYTPHEVSVLMSEIVANHLKDREHIKIYDPTSGSGSLLINIGASMAQYIEGENKVDYYAQELKENTYNLTRMNLVMRGINPANINVRNGDTLEDDWPFFETDENKDETYSLVKVDAVVSNPPYSQKWDPKNKEFDPRFKEFGVAPKAKADYAFLLHELYHLEDDGIMTIVLPHGVLFRGGEEETIRRTLIERNHIEAIIGLPANIFFGTGIPTIIMVLKRTRSDSDVLIIDASKKFEKVGKNNKLRARDIREIVDTLKARKSVTKFAKLVTKDDIRKNEYNLNIPRYVDSSDDEEPWDIHSIMFGGIPNMEIESLRKYWDAFPGLREEIFGNISDNYARVIADDIESAVSNFAAVSNYIAKYHSSFSGFGEYLKDCLIEDILDVNAQSLKENICIDIFNRTTNIKLIDQYKAFQILSENWETITADLEMIQGEGFDAIFQVDPNMVVKKKKEDEDEVTEVQEGWKGHILPFELVQEEVHHGELFAIQSGEERLVEISNMYTEILESLEEDSKFVNTLYLDKMMEYENLIQAFSRTNRLYNMAEKPFGIIKYYRRPNTMEKNIEAAVKAYSGDVPTGLFVDKLPNNLRNMNVLFQSIEQIFKNAGIVNFEKLPTDNAAIGKFAKEFNKFVNHLEAAIIQGFTWNKNSYPDEDQNEDAIKMLIDEQTYLTLLARYKEITRGGGGGAGGDVPYEIDVHITEYDTGKIDANYMNSNFDKYVKLIQGDSDPGVVDAALKELHRSFSMLSQEEQRYAERFIHAVESGQAKLVPGKTFRDYITDYMKADEHARINRVVRRLGCYYALLKELLDRHATPSNIDDRGTFTELKKSVNKTKAENFFRLVFKDD